MLSDFKGSQLEINRIHKYVKIKQLFIKPVKKRIMRKRKYINMNENENKIC